MAVVLGTNAGFVTEAPIADPTGTFNSGTDGSARATKHTTPAGIGKITEMGWYKENVSNQTNYQLCLYSHNANDDLPNTLLYETAATNCDSGIGWQVQSGLDWEVTAETIYWVAVQVDATGGSTDIDYESSGGRDSIDVGIAAPQNPWVSDAVNTRILAIYALVETTVTYSELSGTIAATSVIEDANLEVTTYIGLSGTITATSEVESASLGSTTVGISIETAFIKRLVVAGNNQLFYEDI